MKTAKLKTAEMLLVRDEFTSDYTTGKLYVNGKFFCYTVEDMVRTGEITLVKVPGLTAIPAGSYKVENTYSAKFGVMMLLVLNVRGFSGIRIHNGVSAQSTEGCIVTSYTRLKNGKLVKDSAWKDLRDKLAGYEQIELKIKNGAIIRLTLLTLLLIGFGAYYLYQKGTFKQLSKALAAA
ncbi:DUF5675 family protein [Cytophagaceae bacterium DM2B3-1]|uniref:DUF5675 family protein n=1 Tax=Xanthocytophaga flava TaxID=3048013 RepID=A0ABT7CLC5_9BACT|nr:DUF5675 family protein [Xanthocytophaga flavus]MDJ1494537.1 DUF5675 family protein [Xanthocytophaga flavus]